MRKDENVRDVVTNDIAEFLAAPVIFVKNECFDDYKKLETKMPKHKYTAAEGNKQSFTIEFETIDDRDIAREALADAGIRVRTGKTPVPFRLTSNAAWGVKAPNLDGDTKDLTV